MEPGFTNESALICDGVNFTGTCRSFTASNLGCTFISDDWASSMKLFANHGTCIVLRDDSCGATIELQCGFSGNNCEQHFPNLENYTPGFIGGNIWCSTECDDNPHLNNTVNSVYWSINGCIYED